MITERLDVHISDGRRVAVWRSTSGDPGGPVVVISAGYARTMRSAGAIALCLVRNGCTVYRFDSVNHLGLSDGEIVDFNLEDLDESFRAVIDLARRTERVHEVRLVVLSIAAAAAYKIAVEDPGIDRIVGLSGVVNGVRTLKVACGEDYSVYTQAELPPLVHVDGHDVEPTRLWQAMQPGGGLTPELITARLAEISVPVVNCVATGDTWVDIDDCRQAFTATRDNAPRILVELPFNGHDIAKNPAAVKLVLEELTRYIAGPTPGHDGPPEFEVTFPGFEELLQTRTGERDRAVAEQAGPEMAGRAG
ncbi:hypothetical protein ACFYTQ_01385 [Nocardia sp. NPDC004068]|uniref:hypothetical protein n=1 Tax=Nocardia sp. NPDC004068 TaxID=3364303 RepID=UPI0036AF55F8